MLISAKVRQPMFIQVPMPTAKVLNGAAGTASKLAFYNGSVATLTPATNANVCFGVTVLLMVVIQVLCHCCQLMVQAGSALGYRRQLVQRMVWR
jgi:hypothetical protein